MDEEYKKELVRRQYEAAFKNTENNPAATQFPGMASGMNRNNLEFDAVEAKIHWMDIQIKNLQKENELWKWTSFLTSFGFFFLAISYFIKG